MKLSRLIDIYLNLLADFPAWGRVKAENRKGIGGVRSWPSQWHGEKWHQEKRMQPRRRNSVCLHSLCVDLHLPCAGPVLYNSTIQRRDVYDGGSRAIRKLLGYMWHPWSILWANCTGVPQRYCRFGPKVPQRSQNYNKARWFPSAYKVMCTPSYSLLSMQWHYV